MPPQPSREPRASQSLDASPRPNDRARWIKLLDSIDEEALVATFAARVGGVSGYDPAPIPINEILRTALLTFQELIESLRGARFEQQVTVATDVGVSRARAGVPLTSLMTAIRLDFVVLWEAITRGADASDAELIVRHTELVLNTVDEYSFQTQRAYVAELQRMHGEEVSVRQGMIATLFQDPRPGPQLLAQIATDLGMPTEALLVVVAATGDGIAPLRVAIAELERVGARIYTHHLGDTLVAFWRQLELPGSRIEELERKLVTTLPVAMMTTALGLAGLHQTAATARELAGIRAPDEEGAMTWDRGWARLAARRLHSSGHPVLADVEAALGTCGAAERVRLEGAVCSYLQTGSTGESARELYCHRNTIANRLRRFAELTGLDPTVPAQAARLVVGWA